MSNSRTAIEWTDRTWNPTTGCTKISPGCRYCYAETMARRFTHHFPDGFRFTLHPERLEQPLRWKKPSRIFVDSMSDLFYEKMPIDYLQRAFEIMHSCPQHVFQVLTKRAERLRQIAPLLPWPPNVWIGVSVETQQYTHRVAALRQVPATVRFLSCEPLLGPLELELKDIHWVIAGGESGPRHRPVDERWLLAIRDQCLEADVPFFFKQWGGATPKARGRLLAGRTWDAYPCAPTELRAATAAA